MSPGCLWLILDFRNTVRCYPKHLSHTVITRAKFYDNSSTELYSKRNYSMIQFKTGCQYCPDLQVEKDIVENTDWRDGLEDILAYWQFCPNVIEIGSVCILWWPTEWFIWNENVMTRLYITNDDVVWPIIQKRRYFMQLICRAPNRQNVAF